MVTDTFMLCEALAPNVRSAHAHNLKESLELDSVHVLRNGGRDGAVVVELSPDAASILVLTPLQNR